MKLILLSSSLAVMAGGLVIQSELPGPVKAHLNLLQDAKSLKTDFIIQKLGGGVEKASILYAKGGMFKIDTATTMTESDGKTIWIFNKGANTYSEIPASLAPTKENFVWAWAAFFNPDALKGTKEYVMKGSRTLRGAAVSEFSAKMANNKEFTLYLDTKTGVARGFGNSEAIILATGDIVIGKTAMEAKDFMFVAPAGVTKVEPPVPDKVTFKMVKAILQANCLPCHSSSNMKANLSVDTYDGVMRKVKEGMPAMSGLFTSVTGTKPSMPQGRAPLSKDDVDNIEIWIKAGAKDN